MFLLGDTPARIVSKIVIVVVRRNSGKRGRECEVCRPSRAWMRWCGTGEGLQSRRLSWGRECEAADRAGVGVSTQVVIKLLTPARDSGSLKIYFNLMISLTCFPE